MVRRDRRPSLTIEIATALAVLSMCLDVARWYRPGYRRSLQQLGDFNAAALRVAGADPVS